MEKGEDRYKIEGPICIKLIGPFYFDSTFDRATEDEIGGEMSVQLQVEQMPGYLAARFIGKGVPGEGSAHFLTIADHCERTNNENLLIDITKFDVKASIFDRFFVGEKLQIFARHGIKVAFVHTLEQADPQSFGELVARNRGVNLRTFTDSGAAEKWLLE